MTARQKTCRISFRCAILIQVSMLCAAASLLSAQTNLQSRDGYVRREGNEWILGTSLMERRIRLANGRLSLVSLRNKVSGREYQDALATPAEIRFFVNGQDVNAFNWQWELRGEHIANGNQGELRLDIDVASANIRVRKSYVIYPGTAVTREWMELRSCNKTYPVACCVVA